MRELIPEPIGLASKSACKQGTYLEVCPVALGLFANMGSCHPEVSFAGDGVPALAGRVAGVLLEFGHLEAILFCVLFDVDGFVVCNACTTPSTFCCFRSKLTTAKLFTRLPVGMWHQAV